MYSLSPANANVGRLCEKLKNAMKSGLEQRYDGNFLAIVAEMSIGEKPNFTGRFFKWRRPFDFSTRFTLRTYTHVTRQMQESAAEKMGNFMAQVM